MKVLQRSGFNTLSDECVLGIYRKYWLCEDEHIIFDFCVIFQADKLIGISGSVIDALKRAPPRF